MTAAPVGAGEETTSNFLRELDFKNFKVSECILPETFRSGYEIKEVNKLTDDEGYDKFYSHYLIRNVPCLFMSDGEGNWPCNWRITKEWLTETGTPNWEFISKSFGSAVVPVADCSSQHYNSQTKQNIWLSQYIQYCKKLKEQNHDFKKLPCLYLKDWHFCRAFPDYTLYSTPKYFQSDWLNDFCVSRSEEEDDYRFVYIGPKGTWTPFHSDVFGSYSWSTNICGRKRWILFPPGAEEPLRDGQGKLPYDLSQIQAAQGLDEKHLGIEIIQEAGETIFVPSGWHHQVWNIEDTISVNHNWFNGCNIDLIWSNLHSAFNDVLLELADCKEEEEWDTTCQLVLKAHHGMNFADFLEILKFIVIKSSVTLHESPNRWQCLFDLNRIQHVLNRVKISLEDSKNELLSKEITTLEKSLEKVFCRLS